MTPMEVSELIRLGGEFERDLRIPEAWELLAEGGERRCTSPLPIWEGPGSQGSRLLIHRLIRHVGAELRQARFIASAATAVGEVVVATEPRLIPLLARSFPEAQFIPSAAELGSGCDCHASYERLAIHFGSNEADIEASFRPLLPRDPPAAAGLGIAWFSSNKRKNLPALGDWSALLRGFGGPVQSLQYDEREAGLEELQAASSRPILSSPIDQKLDLDGFASLVASVEGVLTISNTTAHMAGALGIPCVVILDDLDHLTWPSERDRTPFYPRLRYIRKMGRPWFEALQEGLFLLQVEGSIHR